MKGMVFTEFMEMVEDMFGDEVLDNIIDEAELDNDGAYTAVGTYPHTEMVALVQALSEATKTDIPTLLRAYGEHLFGRFSALYPAFFDGETSAFDFLKNIDQYIHVEVRKLYPDAELPQFDYEEPNDNTLVMYYTSPRHLSDFAHGLILGCLKHFGEQADIEMADGEKEDQVIFTLTKP